MKINPGWNDECEWLETDGLGGFASGTVGGIRTRRYHALLMCATNPPTGRVVLVNGVDVTAVTSAGTYPLTAQRYAGDVVAPEGFKLIESFEREPWPTWRYRLPTGDIIDHELFVTDGQPVVAMRWRLVEPADRPLAIEVRPFLSGRDYHALHHENASLRFSPTRQGSRLAWRPYDSLPGIVALASGRWIDASHWYRNFFYREEWLRGFDAVEDLASPGVFRFELRRDKPEAALIFAAQTDRPLALPDTDPIECLAHLRQVELRRRNRFASPLHRAGSQYLAARRAADGSEGRTIIAGYPWFADWGRDTFIAMRGLCLATGRLEDARSILSSWAGHVSLGMLPNRFPDRGETPEYNSVDASLWYVVAACEYFDRAGTAGRDAARILSAIEQILDGYRAGTRHGVRMDDDGLLFAGEPGVQLTWMDAKIRDWVVTPRSGKPVEVQALWANALCAAAARFPRFEPLARRAAMSFRARFWNDARGCLFDVVDVDGHGGTEDARIRPNQLYAVGGLPLVLLDVERARSVVDVAERLLLTPMGLRSLAPDDPAYAPHYTGGPRDRDSAYHQGTVWPFLFGPFVEAWVRVRGCTDDSKSEARDRFLRPLLRHLDEAGLGHISEIADADTPHMPRGCPFQAWSVGELLRLEHTVLAPAGESSRASAVSAPPLIAGLVKPSREVQHPTRVIDVR